MNHISTPDIYVAHAGSAKGRGVFAARDFASDELVETAPVIIIPKPITRTTTRLRAPGTALIKETDSTKIEVELVRELKLLVFAWDELAGVPGVVALALGYGSLYNSANPANLRYEADSVAQTLRFVAERAITRDEELTINYSAQGGGAESRDQNWFVRMGVTPLP